MTYELAKEARNAFVDSLKGLTKEMVELAPDIGTFVMGKRKVGALFYFLDQKVPFVVRTSMVLFSLRNKV